MSVIHVAPHASATVTSCCGKTVFELPRTDRLVIEEGQATCGRGVARDTRPVVPLGTDEQPAQCEETSGGGRCRLPAGHHLHRAGGWTWVVVEPVPGGPGVALPPMPAEAYAPGATPLDPAPAGEPAPVSPPVDAPEPDPALLAAARDWVLRRYPYDPTAYGHPEARDRHVERDARSTAMEAEPRHFWAAGVEEGRRLLDEAAATAAAHAYELGIAEGRRRQAAEVERLQVLLDHAEQYARDLQDGGTVGG